ncbi:hypothetical protein [Breoghania sp. L-A4]|uniref:hypothetical protein n=1 Tax=Breoghania sp. L-A4 TaxID=2304600 RepID=UPI0013C31D18|nr:hypothetical protein [Breoghania sp. L-A4]
MQRQGEQRQHSRGQMGRDEGALPGPAERIGRHARMNEAVQKSPAGRYELKDTQTPQCDVLERDTPSLTTFRDDRLTNGLKNAKAPRSNLPDHAKLHFGAGGGSMLCRLARVACAVTKAGCGRKDPACRPDFFLRISAVRMRAGAGFEFDSNLNRISLKFVSKKRQIC